MFNDKRPPKYLIAKNYEEALAKINTLHLEKNQLNIVYYLNGDKVDALLGVPGYKKDSSNIVFNSATGDAVINFADIETQVKEIIRRNTSSSATYAAEINKKLNQHVLDASTKFEAYDASMAAYKDELTDIVNDLKRHWDNKYDYTVESFTHDINFVNASTYKVAQGLQKTNVLLHNLYKLLGFSEEDDNITEESLFQQITNIHNEIDGLQADVSTLYDITNQHDADIREVRGSLDALYESLNSELGDINTTALRQIAEMNVRINNVDISLNNMEDDMGLFKNRTDASIKDLWNRVEADISVNIANINASLGDLEERISNDISTNISDINASIGDLEERVNQDISSNIANIMNTLYDTSVDINTSIYNINTNISNLMHLIDFTIYEP